MENVKKILKAQNQTGVSEPDRCNFHQKAQKPTKTAVVYFHPRGSM